jgi:EmrB/QacA subfamily drug resistance transporter
MSSEANSDVTVTLELSQRQRVGVLLICCLSLLIVGVDINIVNVALPSIGRQLHAPLSGLQWTIDGYTLVLASLLIFSGSTADRLGRRRTFVAGVLIFSAGSLLCSLSPNLTALVIFRMVQGVGGSMMTPVVLSILNHTFPDRKERARAIGIWAAMFGISMALGPVLGGVLVSSIGWRSIFWVNVPIGLATAFLAHRYVPESRAEVARKFDGPGQALVITMLATLTYGIIEAPKRGLSSGLIVASFALAAAALASFLVWERRSDDPLIDPRFFHSVPFASATVMALFAVSTLGGFLFVNTIYLQDVRKLSPLHAGLDILPLAIAIVISAPICGQVLSRRGSRIPLVLAGSALAVSCLMLTHLSDTTPFSWLFVAYAIFGVGIGFNSTPMTSVALSGMPRDQSGAAAGIVTTARQVGTTLGVAVVGSLISSRLSGSVRFASASHLGWYVMAGCGVLTIVLGFVATSQWARSTARRTALLLNPEYFEGRT